MAAHDDDVKHSQVGSKKNCFYKLKNIPPIVILYLCFLALLFLFTFIEARWEPIRFCLLAYYAKIHGTDVVVSPEKKHEHDDAEHRANRNGKHGQEEDRGEWKIAISYAKSGCCDDGGMGGKRHIPQSMRTGEFPLFVSPLLLGAPGDLFTGRGDGFVVIWFRVHCDSPPNPKKVPAK